MASNFFRRRNFLIQPRFQLRLAAKALLFLFFYTAVIVYSSLRSVTETIYILPFNCLTEEVKGKLLALPIEALLLSLLIALVVALQIILITHRVAGPEFRLQRVIREMAAGQYAQSVTLRKHDCLKELAESVALFGQALHRRRQAVLEQLDQLHGAIAESATHVRSGVHPEAVQAQLEGFAKQICILKQIVVGDTDPGSVDQTLPDPASKRGDSGSVPASCGRV